MGFFQGKNALIRAISLLFLAVFLCAFDEGDTVSIDKNLNARSTPQFSARLSDNVIFGIPAGVVAVISAVKKLPSGNSGLKIKILKSADPTQVGKEVWIYYDTGNPGISLYQGEPIAENKVDDVSQADHAVTERETSALTEKMDEDVAEAQLILQDAAKNSEKLTAKVKALTTPPAICPAFPIPIEEKVDEQKDCAPPPRSQCDPDSIEDNDPREKVFDPWIIEAANRFGINPAILKSVALNESALIATRENEGEKADDAQAAPSDRTGYRWGKGLGQFGADSAPEYGLDWNAPKPSQQIAMSAEYNRPNPETGLYPVWSPRGSLLAVAKKLHDLMEQEHRLPIRDEKGNIIKPVKTFRVDLFYKRNLAETARYLVGMYNRGTRTINSIEEHYRQTGKLPKYYGQAWSTPRTATTPKGKTLLNSQAINRCYISRVVGLCGDEPGGWVKEFGEDFSQTKEGTWVHAD